MYELICLLPRIAIISTLLNALVGFNCVSTIGCYLMPNSLSVYIQWDL